MIGIALVAKAKAKAAGVRTVAARLDRSESTVRTQFCSAGERHAQWLYRRGADRAVAIDRELLIDPAPQRTPWSRVEPADRRRPTGTGSGSVWPGRCGRWLSSPAAAG